MADLLRINEVLELVRRDHPTTTISKIRFLEVNGLIAAIVRDGARWLDPQKVAAALRAEDRRSTEERAPCEVVPLRKR